MPIETLDYAPAALKMEITNQVEADWRMHACAKEPWTVAFIEAIPPGCAFVDVGANVGSYTLVAAARGLRVLAIEPSYTSAHAIGHNLALNDLLDHAEVIQGAAGAFDGWEWLHLQDLRPGAASHQLGGGPRKRFFHRLRVPVYTLDGLLERWAPGCPVYLKVDVDGNEEGVFAGAPKSLAPGGTLAGIMVEMGANNEAALTATLVAAGWRLDRRFHERDGKDIGIAYGEFVRA